MLEEACLWCISLYKPQLKPSKTCIDHGRPLENIGWGHKWINTGKEVYVSNPTQEILK